MLICQSAGFTSFLSQTNSFGIGVTPSSGRTDSSSTDSGSSSGSVSGSPGANPTPSHAENSGGLSTGAKAGIGCGVAITVVGALFILFVFFRRRKTQGQQSAASTTDASKYDGKPELEGSSSVPTDGPYYEEKPELEATIRNFSVESPAEALPTAELPSPDRGAGSEVSSAAAAAELCSSPIVHELPNTPSSKDGRASEKPQHHLPGQGSQSSPWIDPMAGIAQGPERTEAEDIQQLERQERNLADSIDATRTLQQLEAEHAALQERIRLARARVVGRPASRWSQFPESQFFTIYIIMCWVEGSYRAKWKLFSRTVTTRTPTTAATFIPSHPLDSSAYLLYFVPEVFSVRKQGRYDD